MKIALTVGSNENLLDYLKDTQTDIYIIGNERFANRLVGSFDNDQMIEAIKQIKLHHKEVYINMNLIVHHDDLEPVKDYLSFLQGLEIDGIIFGDTSIYNYGKQLNLLDKLIYNPQTLNTNIYDPIFWEKKQIKGLTISNEIIKEEIKEICNESNILTSYYGHGYLNMFHSRRPLIENFLKYNKKDYEEYVNNRKLHLIEEIRNESYPIFQDDKGTHIFRDKIMMSYNEIIEFQTYLDIFIIDSILCDKSYIINTVNNYSLILQGNLDSKELSNSLLDTHDSGFLYKKTVYDKY